MQALGVMITGPYVTRATAKVRSEPNLAVVWMSLIDKLGLMLVSKLVS